MCLAAILWTDNECYLISDNAATSKRDDGNHKVYDVGAKIVQLNDNAGFVWISGSVPYHYLIYEILRDLNYSDDPNDLVILNESSIGGYLAKFNGSSIEVWHIKDNKAEQITKDKKGTMLEFECAPDSEDLVEEMFKRHWGKGTGIPHVANLALHDINKEYPAIGRIGHVVMINEGGYKCLS